MPVSTISRRLFHSIFLLLAFLLATSAIAAKPPTSDLVSRAMNETLVDSGNPFVKLIKQGSYISKLNYRDPLTRNELGQFIVDASDHDARLFISLEDMSAERAGEIWHGFQKRLRSKISAMAKQAGYTPDEIQHMLRSVNLYPPAQMLKGVERNEQAIKAFMGKGNYPNLLEIGEEGAEGLYTTPTKFIRQAYETGERVEVAELVADQSGESFILNIKNTAEAEHAIEGVGETNLEGLTQAAEYQFNETRQALKEGKIESAQKNLERATKNLEKARELAGVQGKGGAVKELEKVKTELDEAIQKAFDSADEAKALLSKGKALATELERNVVKKTTVEFTALESMAGKDSLRTRAFTKGILEGEGNWANLRVKLEEASESAVTSLGSGAQLAYKHWFLGLIALWELKEFPEAVHNEGAAKASVRLATTVAGLANPTFGYLQLFSAIYMMTGELLVDWVSSYGYGAVAGRQDCMDLMAGLYTVPGREQNIEDRTCEQLQDARTLACRIYDQNGLRKQLAGGGKFRSELMPPLLTSLLNCHARAASKHWDDVDSKHDSGVAQALISKCTGPLVKIWVNERQLVVNEIDVLRQGIEERSVTLAASPASLKEKGQVHVSVQDSLDHASVEKEIKDRAACLGGVHADPRFNLSHVWTLNGREVARTYDKGEADITLDAPGNYQICVAIQYDWRVDGLPKVSLEDGISGKASRRGCTTVQVAEPKKDDQNAGSDGAGAAPTDTTSKVKPEPPSCTYDYSDWGECNRTTKKQTHTVTAKKPAGCVEKQPPVLEQGCTPPPSEDDKKNQYFNCLSRCSCGWGGHIGVWYDPEGKSIPECKSNGPCFGGAGAWGCTSRHFFAGPSDCAKGCWESAFGKGTYDPNKADKMRKDENKKFKQPLKVKINASKNPADFGDIVELKAETSEGSGGYSWAWGGCAQDAKEASAKVLNSRECKPCQASVTATDQDGDTASDNLTIQCTALTVRLTKERPTENRLPVGAKADLFAEVLSAGKPASGSFVYNWEPNPDVVYGNSKNPAYETKGGSQSRNSATFRKLGATPVWVTVLKDVGGRNMTMGESSQIPIEIVSPSLKLSADKPSPLIGELVTLRVQEEPKMGDDILSFWWEIAGDATSPGPVANVPNSRAYSFKPKSDKAVTITVHAKSKENGDELGVELLTISAKKLNVSVTGPVISGPAPMIWKEGVGLVAAERQIAEDQRVEFAAQVDSASGQDLRYQWSIAPEGCSLYSPYSKSTGVACSHTGSYSLAVAVKNADGADLGIGNGALNVTLSQSAIASGKSKAQATQKLDHAKQLWSQQQYDAAVAEAEAAAQIDKGLAAPVLAQFSQGLKTMGWNALAKADYTSAVKRLEQAVRLNPADADAKKKLDQARDYAAKWPQVEAKAKEFDDHIAAKRIWSAQRAMLGMQDILRGMALGQTPDNMRWKKVVDDFNTGLQDYNRFIQDKSAKHTQYFKEENYPAMLQNALDMRSRELSAADEKECQSRIDFAKHFLGAADYARQAVELTRQGQYDQALAAVLKGREIHPKSVDAAARALADVTKRLGKEAELKRDFQASGHLFDIARKAMPQDNEAHIGANNAPVYQKRVNEVRAWQREVETMIGNGDWDLSAARLEDIKRWEALIPGPMFPETRALIERQDKGFAAYKAYVEPRKQSIGSDLNKACLEKARAGIMELRSRHLIRMDQDWTRVFLNTIEEGLRTCKLGNVPLKNNCGRSCGQDGSAVNPANGNPSGNAPVVSGSSGFYHVDLTPYGGKKAAPRKVKDIEVDDGSWVRLKATQEKRLVLDIPINPPVAASAVAIVSNLDNAHNVPDGAIVTHLTVHTSAGDRRFEIKAGIHSSEWNREEGSGAVHRFPKDNYLGDKRWLATFGLPAGSQVTGLHFDHVNPDKKYYHMGEAPGFCLRGITLLGKAVTYPVTAPTPAPSTGSNGEAVFQGHRYRAVLVPSGINWADAERAARGMGGHLATVTSPAENNAIWSLVRDNDRFWYIDPYHNGIGPWLGGHQPTGSPEPGGGWNWVTGEPFSYTNWAPREPDNFGSTEDRLHFFGLGQLKSSGWNDVAGSLGSVRGYVVEFEPGQNPQTPAGGNSSSTNNVGTNFGSAISTIIGAVSGANPPTGSLPAPGASACATGNVLYENGNIGGVGNQPSQQTIVHLAQPAVLSLIQDYHWNNARGATPGSIGLRSVNGQMYGPWPTQGSPGQGGVPNAYWTARPNVSLPAGDYTVVDSDPASWAQNGQSGGAGFTRLEGCPTGGRSYTYAPQPQSGNSPMQAPAVLPGGANGMPNNANELINQLRGIFK